MFSLGVPAQQLTDSILKRIDVTRSPLPHRLA